MAPRSIIRGPTYRICVCKLLPGFYILIGVMGKASKALKAFIVGMPDDKLSGFTSGEHTLYSDTDFRLDNQGV